MYRRLLLIALLGLTLSACVPYYDGGATYYRSEVYTAPAPAYYYGGPRYYPRAGYRPSQNQGWGDRWGNGGRGRGSDHGGGRGGHR